MVKKQQIKERNIYECFYFTQNVIGNKTQFEKMVDWFELNDYELTQSAWKRVSKFLQQKSLVLNLLNNTK